MHSQLREQAIKLRIENELSYSAIRERLNVSKSTLSYWLREMPLSEEKILELRRNGWQKGEASRERFRATMREKREQKDRVMYDEQRKKLSNLTKETFFVAGLMLYLGEGDKKNSARIALANTDSRIITFFIRRMTDFLDIARENIRAELHLYENMDIEEEKKFWKDALDFSESQFYKTQIRKLQSSSFSYPESYRHGTCSIFLPGVEKKREIMMATQAFLDEYMSE